MVKKLDTIAVIEASISDGGWKASGEIFNNANSLDWYKPVDAWFYLFGNGSWDSDPRLAFSGHLIPDTFSKTLQASKSPWTAFTAQEFLKQGTVQGIFFKNVPSSPANNHQIVNMTYADIIEELLGIDTQYGHTNLVQGVWPEGFLKLNIDSVNSVLAGEHEIKEGNFWQVLQEIANIEFYLLFVNRFNILNYIPHPMFGTLPVPVFDLDESWLLKPLSITPRNTSQVGQIRLHGTTPQGQQISGIYPADPGNGPIVSDSGFKAASAATMVTVAQRKYLYANRDYSVSASISGAVGCMIDLMDRVSITYQSALDGIEWVQKKFWIEAIRVELLSNFSSRTTLSLEAENAN